MLHLGFSCVRALLSVAKPYAHDLGLSRLVLDLDHSDQAELVVSLEHLGQAVALQDINGDGQAASQ